MTRKTRTTEDEVGYGKPPKRTRFKPGQSGNPKGRPKGARGVRPILEKLLKSTVVVRDAEGERRVTVEEATHRALFAKAMQGNVTAIRMVMSLLQQYDLDRSPDEPQRHGVLVVPAPMSPAEWMAKFGAVYADAAEE